MANILGLITINGKDVLEVDAIPSAVPGTDAPIGSMAMFDNGGGVIGSGKAYVKIGPLPVDWDVVLTSTLGGVGEGNYLRLPIYDTNATGFHVDDTVLQGTFAIDVAIQAQAGRTAALEYRIPNPGNAITTADFILSEGAQTKNGDMTFNNNVVIGGDLTVNGSLTYLNSTNTDIKDALITLNKGGGIASGGGVGFEIEEKIALVPTITGYFKTAVDRNGFELLAPGIAFKNDLDLSNLSANRVQKFANTSGTFTMRADATPGVATQIAYWTDANTLAPVTGFTFVTGVVTIPSVVVTNLGLGVVHSSAGGALTSSAVVLTSEVSGILPVANGGTNSSTTLSNGRLMYSNAGTIVEYSAMSPNQVYFGAASTGLPAQSANLFWDITNSRLGIGNAAPTRTLDVTGNVLMTGFVKVADASKANYELRPITDSTASATMKPIQTIAIPLDSEVVIEARILGRRSSNGDSCAYVRTARFKNIGGTVTRASLQTDFTSEDVLAWNATIAAVGTNAEVQVTGGAYAIDWTCTSIVQILQ